MLNSRPTTTSHKSNIRHSAFTSWRWSTRIHTCAWVIWYWPQGGDVLHFVQIWLISFVD